MRRGEALPRVGRQTPLSKALLEMTRKGLGLTAVLDDEQRVLGVFTDGDLRRALDRRDRSCTTPMQRRHDAGRPPYRRPASWPRPPPQLMELHRVTALLVTDAERRLIGALNVHDLHAGWCGLKRAPARPARTGRWRSIRLLVLDVDGVMTDGRLEYDADGERGKSFHVRDGYGHQGGAGCRYRGRRHLRPAIRRNAAPLRGAGHPARAPGRR